MQTGINAQSQHRIDLLTFRIVRAQLDISLHHLELPVDDVVTQNELDSDHFAVLHTVKCSMSIGLRPDASHVRWDLFRQHLNSFKIPSDLFLLIDALEIRIGTFSKTSRSVKIAGQCAGHMRPLNTFLVSVI